MDHFSLERGEAKKLMHFHLSAMLALVIMGSQQIVKPQSSICSGSTHNNSALTNNTG